MVVVNLKTWRLSLRVWAGSPVGSRDCWGSSRALLRCMSCHFTSAVHRPRLIDLREFNDGWYVLVRLAHSCVVCVCVSCVRSARVWIMETVCMPCVWVSCVYLFANSQDMPWTEFLRALSLSSCAHALCLFPLSIFFCAQVLAVLLVYLFGFGR